MIKMASRSYSKWMIAANCGLGWGTIYMSIYYHEAAYVAVAGYSFIAAIAAYYMKVGHNDLKETLNAISSTRSDAAPPLTDPTAIPDSTGGTTNVSISTQ